MRLLLVSLMFFFGVVNAKAMVLQKPEVVKSNIVKKAIILKKDSSKVDLRRIDEQAVKTYSKQKEFIYDDVKPPSPSWWERFWSWFWELIGKIFSSDGNRGTGFTKVILIFLKWFLIVLAVALIAFIVIKLIGLDLKFLTGKSKAIDVPYEESLENIHEINFDEQIERAIENGNYRLVVRLLYLKTLKHLTDKQLINWQPEKTNQAYVLELENENHQEDFTKLTYQFEYIWYGEFFIDKNTFEPIQQSFQQFNQRTA